MMMRISYIFFPTYNLSSLYILLSSLAFFAQSIFAFPGATVVSIISRAQTLRTIKTNGYVLPPQYTNMNNPDKTLGRSISISSIDDIASTSIFKFTYRSAENKDLARISNLVCDNLYRNSPKGWFIDKFIRVYRELDTQQALQHRMMSYMNSDQTFARETGNSYRYHRMLVAVGASWSQDNQMNEQPRITVTDKYTENLIGFIEIGQVKIQSLIPGRQSQSLVAHIGNLVVADGFRRQGVGLGLMTEACQTAKSWGYPAVYCGVHSTNSAAIDLYTRKLDFRIVHSKMSEDGDIDYVLEKLLS